MSQKVDIGGALATGKAKGAHMTATMLKMLESYMMDDDKYSLDNVDQIEAVRKTCSLLWNSTADERFSGRYEVHEVDDDRELVFGNAVIDLGGGLCASLHFEVLPGYDREVFELAFLRGGSVAAEPQRFRYAEIDKAAETIRIVRRSLGGGSSVFDEQLDHFHTEEGGE